MLHNIITPEGIYIYRVIRKVNDQLNSAVYELSQFTVKVEPLWNITRCPLQQEGVEITYV